MIIERLADPLVHIIRNSLDHGAESKSERLACNKEQKALLRVGAKSEGDRVVIIIEDDGRGIDADKVVQKALEKGLVDAEALEKMSQKEKLQLIFLPGLSTKEEISELSGRGVGTDAVRSIIYELGGKIEVASILGKGTKTTIEIPISVALSSVFHVMLGNTNFAINMECINVTVKVEAKEIAYINEQPILKLRGELIPLVFYYDLLSQEIKNAEAYSLLILEAGGVKFGFVVDAFVSQLDIVQKPPSAYLTNHRFISGTSLLGNGEVLFLINASRLLKNTSVNK
jgi:two-component system chemotaxis sensor kinase CheA